MAQLHGKGGSVIWSGTGTVGGEITNWTLDVTADTAESSSMATTHKTFLGGWKDWTATVTVKWDNADIDFLDAVGAAVNTLELEMLDGGHSITMTSGGICTSAAITTDANDVIGVVFTFVCAADAVPTYNA